MRILDAYDKSCFKFMEHFLRVSFKYKENPFEYDTEQVKPNKKQDKINLILELCKEPRSLKEICDKFGFKDTRTFKKNYLNNLIDNGRLQMTMPDNPKNRNQKYVAILQK